MSISFLTITLKDLLVFLLALLLVLLLALLLVVLCYCRAISTLLLR